MRIVHPRALAVVPALALMFFHPGARPAAEGAIAGNVRDQAGAPIANAQVVVVGTAHSTLTDSAGRYEIRRVEPGTYALRAAFIGYRAVRVESVTVRPGATTRQDFALQATTVEVQEIAVQAGAPAVARDEVTSKGRVDERFTDHLPIDRVAYEEASVTTSASSAEMGNAHPGIVHRRREPWNTEEYSRIYENRFLDARSNPLSTFSIDVDRASYSNVRRFLMNGQLPPADAVRIEELVNYFTYEYAEPSGTHPFTVATDIAPAPWNPHHRLLRIGLQGKRHASGSLPPSNLVFLVDVSGSMQSEDKLPLVKQAFRVLVRQLRPEDRVSIVVYAGSAGLVLPPTRGNDRETILSAIERLEAGGSTAGGAGIRLAYDVARRHFVREGNNRVILATDGDFNVGVSSTSELIRLIEEKRAEGTYLTVLGFGTGNYKDGRMEQLADKGNGNYAYIDNVMEANKVFGTELTSTLFTIARDVKLQIEFNPAIVRGYRLIGYENRLLAREDFNDDTKDAGELGAGHTVTALYEIIPVGAESDASLGSVDPLRYQQEDHGRVEPSHRGEWLTVKLRYKPLDSDRSRLLSHTVRERDSRAEVAGDFAFAAAVASFGMVLRDSEFRGSASFGQALRLARAGRGADEHGYRAEFIRLIETAQSIGIAVRGE
ncbi:MAG TPA: von Willebrand factor type A domain-containing protein [Gemmatimonadales bacterium]|nr:von Willebrand factor type A domain-containing protein [Gemmatimonadales bacterium]